MKRNPDLSASVDERLSAAINKSNLLITINNQKQNIRLKLESDLTFAVFGGIFKVEPQLISFVHNLIDMGQTDCVLLDKKQNPIFIADLEEFLSQIVEVYYQSTNAFMAEFKKIQKTRNVEALVGDK